MRSAYLEYRLVNTSDDVVSEGVLIFAVAKHFHLNPVTIATEWTEQESTFELTLTSQHLAKYVELEFPDLDVKWSDNYFDLCPDQVKKVTLRKDRLPSSVTLETLQSSLYIRSAVDMTD